jgi:hypothetical protein
MKFLRVLLAFTLIAACTSQTAVPQPTALDLPDDPRIVVTANPISASMLSDCVRSDFVLDTASPPTVPVTRAQVEQSADPLGDRPAPLAVVLGRLTMNLQDSRGDLIRSRPAWVVYRTEMMNKLPRGAGFSRALPRLRVPCTYPPRRSPSLTQPPAKASGEWPAASSAPVDLFSRSLLETATRGLAARRCRRLRLKRWLSCDRNYMANGSANQRGAEVRHGRQAPR